MTTPTTKPADRSRPRTMLFPLTADQLLPTDLPGLPEPVAAANERAHAARREYDDLRATASELRRQAEAAPRFDQLAAEAAIDAGEQPPKATAAAKEQRAAEAEGHVAAAEQVAKRRTRELYEAVEDNYDAYLDARRAAYKDARQAVEELPPTILARLPRLRAEGGLLRAAEEFVNNPAVGALDPSRGRDAAVQRRYDRALTEARKAGPRTLVGRDLVSLLAALAVLLEDGKEAA